VSAGSAVAREWALHLFQMTLQGSLVAALLLAFAAASPRSSPRFRSALLSIALAKFVVPPMLPFPTGVFSRFDASPRAFFSRCGVGACAAIALLHGTGFAVSLARLVAVRRRARGWVRRSRPLEGSAAGVSAAAGAWISEDVAVPCAVGGRILLPERLAAALVKGELEAVILHEREHLARRDPAMAAFEGFVAAFWWFHPIARVLLARRREIREERCDDAVLRRVSRDTYRRALVAAAAFAGAGRPAASVAATGPAAELARRLRRIADSSPRRRRRIAAAVAVAAATALLLPGVRPAAGPAFHAERTSR